MNDLSDREAFQPNLSIRCLLNQTLTTQTDGNGNKVTCDFTDPMDQDYLHEGGIFTAYSACPDSSSMPSSFTD